MAEVSSAEVSKNFSTFREMADGSRGVPEPVLVLHCNKPSVVIVAAEEYGRLQRRDRVAGATEDLPEWRARRIAESELDTWPTELRQIPHRRGVFHYGHLPPSMFRAIRDAFRKRYRDMRIMQVNRT